MLDSPLASLHHQTCSVVKIFPGHDSRVLFPSFFAVFFVLSGLIVKIKVIVLPETGFFVRLDPESMIPVLVREGVPEAGLRFLKELGFSPEKDLHEQLTFIRDAADDYEDACTLFRESEEELRLFDEELRRSGLTAESLQSAGIINEDKRQDQIRESRQSPAALRRRREEIQEELLQCRAQETDVEDRLADLVREREERDAMREELDELCAQQKKDTASYRQIRMASQLLQKAKESLTSRYADPIRTNFCRYWETITGYAANHVYVDANSHITIGEGGKQRDAALFSTGWRDLTGICLRAALADAMYPAERSERPPLILDDPFTNLDDEKIEGAMHFLEETGRHYQILYFTCSITRC